MTVSLDHAPLVRTVAARSLKALDAEIARAKAHFGLPATAAVESCYEAGCDGCWLHRYLVSRGIANVIVDSSSLEVGRSGQSVADGGSWTNNGSTRRVIDCACYSTSSRGLDG